MKCASSRTASNVSVESRRVVDLGVVDLRYEPMAQDRDRDARAARQLRVIPILAARRDHDLVSGVLLDDQSDAVKVAADSLYVAARLNMTPSHPKSLRSVVVTVVFVSERRLQRAPRLVAVGRSRR
jgi:hypothetical protein